MDNKLVGGNVSASKNGTTCFIIDFFNAIFRYGKPSNDSELLPLTKRVMSETMAKLGDTIDEIGDKHGFGKQNYILLLNHILYHLVLILWICLEN